MAMEKSSGVQAEIQVKPSYGLDESQISDMLKASMQNATGDMQARMLKEQQVEAARVHEALQAALNADGAELLSAAEIETIQASLAVLDTAGKNDDIDAIKKAISAADAASQIFAEKRMDHSIKKALAGHTVDSI